MLDQATGTKPTPEQIARLDELFERHYPSTTPESTALVDRISVLTRTENQIAAKRLIAIAELFAFRLRRCSETEDWAVDTMEAVSAEVAAALRISQDLARSHLRYARALRERLPSVAEVFKAGDIDFRLLQTLVYRTDLITDADVLAAVDAELAVMVPRWPSMTRGRLVGKVDTIVARADKDAVRRRRDQYKGREISIWDSDSGMSGICGGMFTHDAQALDKRLDALADTVCEHDPRTRRERRADALGALAAGADRLGCRCESADCPAGAKRPAGPVTIHVIAEQATINGTGDAPGWRQQADGLIPPELIRELAESARVVPLAHPGDGPPEPRYVPSKALADFVRWRDLTCRFPGCDVPARNCDIDHSIPFAAGGPTHPSNLHCKCRTHHLVKTFWGWREKQLPDGTIIFTAPTGHVYVTTPGSALFLPTLCLPTGVLSAPVPDLAGPPGAEWGGARTAMMPRRSRTRAQERAHRIAAERRQNREARTTCLAEQRRKSAPTRADDEPPPF
jgi:hypothetical protein